MWSRMLAFLLLLICTPVLLVFGAVIYIRYPGPFFYSQLREGRNGASFKIWKLRTMVRNAGQVLEELLAANKELSAEWKTYGCLRSDPRVAGRIARFARQSSIDELPQLWNVCKGEMAFIGPRPLELFLAGQLPAATRATRNSVLPGMTGLWQVGPRSSVDIRQMQHYDLQYVKNRSAALDVYILRQTIATLLKRKGN